MKDKMLMDFNSALWSYLLGVVHGDGHVAPRSISISVSYKEPVYLSILEGIICELGYRPRIYRPRSAYRIDIHNRYLADCLRQTKSAGIWKIPADIDIGAYFSGVIDTDGHLTKPPQRQVVITLKRSGNLVRLTERLSKAGLRSNPVHLRTANYNGSAYEIEECRWAGCDQIDWIGLNCSLRHPRKQARLAAMIAEIVEWKSRVPLWKTVARWLIEAPRDIDEIMAQFNLTKRQADSVLGNIKAECNLEIIPPPRILTKYCVKGMS